MSSFQKVKKKSKKKGGSKDGSDYSASSSNQSSSTSSHLPSSSHFTLNPPGTLPRPSSTTLTSTGLKSLDFLINGGLVLQTVTVLEKGGRVCGSTVLEDLEGYYLGVGCVWGQGVGVVTFEEDGGEDDFDEGTATRKWRGRIPLDVGLYKILNGGMSNISSKKDEKKRVDATNAASLSVLDDVMEQSGTIKEGDEEEEDEASDEFTDMEKVVASDDVLNIAWQYRQDVQGKRSALGPAVELSSSPSQPCEVGSDDAARHYTPLYCPSFDLSSPLQQSFCSPSHHTLSSCSPYALIFKAFVSLIQRHYTLPSSKGGVLRLLVKGSPLCPLPIGNLARALPLIVQWIKANSLPVVLMISLETSTNLSSSSTTSSNNSSTSTFSDLTLLKSHASLVCSLTSYASLKTPVPASTLLSSTPTSPFIATLTINPLFPMGSVGGHAISNASTIISSKNSDGATSSTVGTSGSATGVIKGISNRFGVRRDKRRVVIEMMHLQPEEEEEETQQQTTSSGGERRVNPPGGVAKKTAALKLGEGCGSGGGKGRSDPLAF